ncbi:MAG: GspH/FimT family pseudopilin [Pseudomonadales bacterium]|nr:GspH/FimT family pseudopilin [Halioglobus sp.]MCP5130050.1 GspH/FimT family pseudopilin [Pseudomonadales bacterium]
MDRMSCEFNHRGLTLIELMITLVVLAVTVTVAAPAMQQMVHDSRLRAETSRLLDAVNTARSEAIFRNLPVSLCPSRMAATGVALCDGSYADGWIVFANRNGDEVVDAGDDEVIGVFDSIPRGYRLTNAQGTRAVDSLITYRADGSSRRNLSMLLCPPDGHRLLPWTVVLNNVGRARAEKGDALCTAVDG